LGVEIPRGGLDELSVVASRMGLSYGVSDGACAPGSVERNWLIGTVARAVAEFVRYKNATNPRSKMVYKRAQLWLFTTYNGKGPPPGSFEWCCEWLDEDPEIGRARALSLDIADLPKVDHFSSDRSRRK
jgi:hypothetical protein